MKKYIDKDNVLIFPDDRDNPPEYEVPFEETLFQEEDLINAFHLLEIIHSEELIYG